ncbi:hypothetical protein Emtol_2419 [Emticicia oligotrophica DSM 17448]|uniref:PorV/PorQ family protein n=1 Tax=Emticicia oligotrophica (strain DSM 17448 / CIP 109782 / MTCC 6937 / GPTSA100-15) TaxID=929562 RepID=A0ABN4AMZ8_EMTOG|nr:hypothetical protein [Emticicia oligotrophica]AFK03555.1 hypothetical protein Emtol_2419 [Emticicia oligotrophica DSM 17448]
MLKTLAVYYKSDYCFHKLTFSCCFIFILKTNNIWASGEPFPIGAKSWGIGNATTALADRNSIFSNPAGLGFVQENFVSTSYHARYNISGLQTLALSGNYLTKFANLGFGIERFGDKLYNEQKVGLVMGKSMNRVALGVKISYFQAAIENFAAKNTLLTEFGIMTKLSSKVQLGFHAYNLTGAKLFTSQRIPTVLRLGLSFAPSKQILMITEAEKDLDFPMLIKAGIEYQIVKNFYLRTGINSKINQFHFGFGLQAKQFIFDYAISSHEALGFSNHLSISYQMSKFIPVKSNN